MLHRLPRERRCDSARRGRRVRDFDGTTTTTGARARATPFDDSGPTARFGPVAVGAAFVLALATFLVFAGFTPILPTADRRLDPAGRRRPRRHHPHRSDRHRTCAAEIREAGRARRRAAAQPVRRAVFAGRRHPGDRHRGRRDGFGRMGDQPALHERRRRLHQRIEPGDPALSANPSAGRCCATSS